MMHFSNDQTAFAHHDRPKTQAIFNVARPQMAALVAALFFAVSLIGNVAYGQDIPDVPPPPSHEVAVNVDSGMVVNQGEQLELVWSETITVKDAQWLQLSFSEVILTKGKKQESCLRITSLEDRAVQILDAECCKQWRNKSAFFNGNSVKVELLAHPKAEANCVVIENVTAGEVPDQNTQESICDGVDDRVLSNSLRVARTNAGCTAWLFNGRSNDMITAGHCAASMTTVFFRVPLSDSNGTINFPSPDDQYAVCADSVQFENGGIGNDWCYFGVFDNSNTGLSPLDAQGASYTLARPAANTFDTNDFLRVTGYGVTSFPVNPTWNQAQKTNAGPFVALSGNALSYRPDTTGGNSGSPVTLRSTNIAYGVHTHGGCGNGTGANSGTGLNHPDFWAAINNPQGACVPTIRPDNNNCVDAIVIRTGNFNFDTTNATTDGPTLPPECNEGAGLSFVNDIWYEYRSPCTGSVNFDFCDSNYDTRVAAYTSCGGELLACNDDSCGLQSEMTFDVVEGESYWIRVGGFSGSGSGTMTVTCTSSDCSEFVEVVDGNMIIMATQMPDEITVTQNSSLLEVNVNNVCVETFILAEINRVVVFGYGGSDLIQIDARVETTIHGGFGADMIFGGDLSADIFGGPGADSIIGGPADDHINGGRGNDVAEGLAGNDELIGGDSTDILSGGAGDDTLFGGLGGDTLLGGNGNDLLVGNAGADTLNGNGGNDELIGFGGPDEMIGGPGDDDFTGGAGFDTMDGGGGNDSALDNGEVEIGIEN